MALNFNVEPYYDDFDETKNFHRILFKPGYAVQARELTQSQTILQDQIAKFGEGIYKDGSNVTGGNLFVDASVVTVKLTSASEAVIENYNKLYVTGQTSKFVAQVIEIDAVNYYLKTKPINTNNSQNFSSGETLNFFNTKVEALSSINATVAPKYTDVVATSNVITRLSSGDYLSTTLNVPTGNISVGDTVEIESLTFYAKVVSIKDNNSLILSVPLSETVTNITTKITNNVSVRALQVAVDEGVWFTSGYFVRNDKTFIIPDALSAYPSVVVGFEVEENIIDSFNDASLLDPAFGASNYQAPGADRYKITLNLVAKPYVSDQVIANLTTNKFIELLRINNGTIESIKNTPIFTSISKKIADSVYDQAGDFIVNPFSLAITNSATSSQSLPATISAGKAYLKGAAVERIAPTAITLEKARDTEALIFQDISTYYGNYTIVKNIGGSVINFQTGTQVELHNVAFGAASTGTKIGVANVRNFDYHEGTLANTQHKMFLYDVVLTNTNGQTFDNVASLIVPNGGNYSSPTFSANTVTPTTLVDSNFNSLIFPLPQQNISNTSSVNYVTHRYYTTSTFSGGVVTINTNGPTETFVGGSGAISSAQRQLNYMVVVGSTSGSYTAGSFIPMDQSNVTITITNSPGTPQATINIGGNYSGSATILATISQQNDGVKSKVLNSNTAVVVSANTLNQAIDIGLSDVYKFKGVYELGNTRPWLGTWNSGTSYTTNSAVLYTDTVYVAAANNSNSQPNISSNNWTKLTNSIANYRTDDGQRDAYYDHGSIRNVSGSAKGNVAVVVDYFTHSGGQGYFSVDSYAVDYANIPKFTSQQYGSTYNLSDVLDFRPRRTDGIGTKTFDTFKLTSPFNNVFMNYGYYLGRIDKIVLYPNGQFKNIRGISSYTNPVAPSDLSDALTMFTLKYPPYTFDKNDIIVTPNNTRRYTMKDIGVLDKRITNLEYYTSLSLLEKEAKGSDVTDATGQNLLFKNGFLVDSFKGQGVGDVLNPDYAASIDFNRQLLRPFFTSNVVSYSVDTNQGVFNAGKRNNYLTVKNNLLTFSYDERSFVYQNVATQFINVNPFNVVNFVGDVKITPSSDVWYDTQSAPIVNIVNEDQAAWLAAVRGTGHGTQWNDWELNWTGQNPVDVNDQGQVSRNTEAIASSLRAKGFTGTVQGGNIQVSSTTKVISNAIIPFARSIPIHFRVAGLAPYTQLHTFLNGVCVSPFVTPAPGFSSGLYRIDIVNPGTGYADGNNQNIITITGPAQLPAEATANVSGGQVVKVDITKTGAGYTPGIKNPELKANTASTKDLPYYYPDSFMSPTTPSNPAYEYDSSIIINVSGANTSTAVLKANTHSYRGAPLYSDKNGFVEGTILIPNDDLYKISSGTIIVEFSDNILSPATGTSYAKATFLSQGTLQTKETTVVSTRPPILTPKKQVTETRTPTVTYNPTYPAAGTLLISYCKDKDRWGKFADGRGGTYESLQEANSAFCGYTVPAANSTVLVYKVNPSNLLTGANNYVVGSDEEATYVTTFANTYYYLEKPEQVKPTFDNDEFLNFYRVGSANYPGGAYAILQKLVGAGNVTGDMAASTAGVYSQVKASNPDLTTDQLLGAFERLFKDKTPNQIDAMAISFGLANHSQTVPANAAAAAAAASQLDCLNGKDPLSQNFFISGDRYPNGLFLSSVTLFFASKDTTVPVSVRIRPTVNGYPDSVNDIPGSIVYKNPNEVSVPAEADKLKSIGPGTTFTFDHPIYLKPGEYSIMVAANTDEYTVYSMKLGQKQLGTDATISQLNYLGSLFKSQNAATWVPAPGETLSFILNICDFAGGSATFSAQSKTTGAINYDLIQLIDADLSFNRQDGVTYGLLTRDLASNTQSSLTNVNVNENYNFSVRQKQQNAGDIVIRATMNNTDRFTSPVIDLERLNTILVTNSITPYEAANTTAESLGGFGNGTAVARYISRRVTLNNNFDSTGLTVYMDVNRQPGTKIEVYYKVMNALDTNSFDDQPYVLMSPILVPGSGVSYTGPTDWVTDTYQALGIQYNDITTGVTYSNFKVFAIKVVMYSDNPCFVPQIKNFRAIATA